MVLIYPLLTNPYISPGSWRCQTVYYSHLPLDPTSSFLTVSISLKRDCHPLWPNVTIYLCSAILGISGKPTLVGPGPRKMIKGNTLKIRSNST